MIDMTKIQPGDMVTIRAQVIERHLFRTKPGPGFLVAVKQPAGSYTELDDIEVCPDDVMTHEPAPPPPLKVGERVRTTSGRGPPEGWPILHIHAGLAWLGDPHDTGIIRSVSTLERLPADTDAQSLAASRGSRLAQADQPSPTNSNTNAEPSGAREP